MHLGKLSPKQSKFFRKFLDSKVRPLYELAQSITEALQGVGLQGMNCPNVSAISVSRRIQFFTAFYIFTSYFAILHDACDVSSKFLGSQPGPAILASRARIMAMEAPRMEVMGSDATPYAGLFPDSAGDQPIMTDVIIENQKRLATYHWAVTEPKGLVVLVHGFGEHLGRYFHVANFFVKQGRGLHRWSAFYKHILKLEVLLASFGHFCLDLYLPPNHNENTSNIQILENKLILKNHYLLQSMCPCA